MLLIGKDKLEKFSRKHADIRRVLQVWVIDVESEKWLTPQDIKKAYQSADFIADNRVIFNLKGNHYRLVVKVRYSHGIALIEWIGTHAEYSKKRF